MTNEPLQQNKIEVLSSNSALNILSALLFLFFIQQLTFLIESIYMLNLLHTSMDSRALGILFLALPALLYFVKHNKATYTIIVSVMLICMLLSTLLATPLVIFSSGIGAGLFLLYFGLQLSDVKFQKVNWGQSAALATLISIFFRVIGHTLDISITGNTKSIGWILLLVAGYVFYQEMKTYPNPVELANDTNENQSEEPSRWASWSAIRGIAASFIFIYFVFSSPGVLARWTEGDYLIIHLVLILFIMLIAIFGFRKIIYLERLRLVLVVWNGLFLISFIWNILLHRVNFPSLENLTPVVVTESTFFTNLITYVMLILSPVIFVNIAWFSNFIKPSKPNKLVWPLLRSVGLIIVCIFILIFTNTWGYVGEISKIFRNQFHIPFIIAGIVLIAPFAFTKGNLTIHGFSLNSTRVYKLLATIVAFAGSGFLLLNTIPIDLKSENRNEITLMTYNIQQGVDLFGNKNFEGQLALIENINPDIICLQESDASRISGGNSDVVHYFASKLGYHSYYGPKTVSGTFGTAILSRFPMDSCRTIFTYSNKDEIGTAVAVISVGSKDITIINSHPAGKEKAKHEHIDMVVSMAKDNKNVIAMGDYNFRQDSPYYKKITSILKDSWLSLYPDAIGPVETEMLDPSYTDRKRSSGNMMEAGKQDMTNRIDHIFLSKGFEVQEAHYLPAPESETDHPVHWAVVSWE